MTNKLKIVVVGPGLMGMQHIQQIKESPNVELSAIVAPEIELNRRVATEEQVPLYHSIKECLNQEKFDGVIIASPNEYHAEQARCCIEARLPVLIEKPITSNVQEGKEIVKLVEQTNAKVLIGHHRAYSPILTKACSAIKEGRLGRLVSVIGSAQFFKPLHYFQEGPWRTQIGGGPILINLIHEIGNIRTLLGEIVAVQAVASSNIRGFVVEDTVAIILIFKNGALGTFLLSDTAATAKSWEQTSRENPRFPSYADEDCYTIVGTKGSLSVPTMRMKYYPDDKEPSWWTPFSEEILNVTLLNPFRCQLEHFIEIIHGNIEPKVSAREGYRNLLITEAIKKSAFTKTIVYIEE